MNAFWKPKYPPAEATKLETNKLLFMVGETSESTKSELERLVEELEARSEGGPND